MNTGLKPYASYRDSGIPWLGDMPSHWKAERAKRLFREMERPVGASDEVVTCFRDGVVTLRKNRRVRGFTESLKEFGYQGIRRGDLVIHAMDAFAGAIGVSDSNGKATSVYSVCVPRMISVNVQYYAHCVREMARSQWILALSKGIRERSTDFRYSVFGSLIVPLPPPLEQTTIVRFLDHVDRRIRRYVRAKEKLIALLEEQKQVLIHDAVTGRIDVRTGRPYAAYKPSGVECLGEVPVHWEARRLRNVAEMRVSNVDKKAKDDECPVRLCNYTDVYKNDRIRAEMSFMVATASTDEIERFGLRTGDVLITKDSEAWNDIGVPALVESAASDVVSGYHLALLRPDARQISGAYLHRVLSSVGVADQFYVGANGVTRYGLSQNTIRSVWLPLASLSEQTSIACFLNENAATTDDSISRAYRHIDLLHEYRSRLISDIVTGKLDVREAAAALPEEPIGPGAAEGDCTGTEHSDEVRTDHSRRTEFSAAQEEMIE